MRKKTKILTLVIVIGVFCLSIYPFFASIKISALVNKNIVVTLTHLNQAYTFNLYNNKLDYLNPDIKRELDKRNYFESVSEKKRLIDEYLGWGFSKKEVVDFALINFADFTKDIRDKINKASSNARVNFQPDSKPMFTFYKDSSGIEVDEAKLYQLVYANLERGTFSIKIPTKKIDPSLTEKELKQNTVKKSSFYTNYSVSSAERKWNVRLALSKFNGMVVEPFQEVSFNTVVGERTEKNGYKTAKIIVNAKYVDGIGGGVCQASTTLYNACLYAGLKIVKHCRHSLQSSYVKPSFDAMVNSGSADMVFRNTTDHAIYIKVVYTDNDIGVEIFGEPNKFEIKLRSEVTKRIKAGEKVILDTEKKYIDKVRFADEVYVLQEAHDEVQSEGYRDFYQDGKKVSSELLRKDRYLIQEGIYIRGTEPRA